MSEDYFLAEISPVGPKISLETEEKYDHQKAKGQDTGVAKQVPDEGI